MFNLENLTIMAKKYIDAELQIVRTNSDIVTASVTIGGAITDRNVTADAPERRRSIWD